MQGSKQRATINDAFDYVRAVKETFSDKEEIYNEFLQVLKDFTAHRIDPAVVVARVKELFKGHEKLILDFNKYLPNGFQVTLSPEIAFNFFKKLTLRLQGDYHVYKSFLEIMSMFRRKEKTLSETYDEVAFLLQNYEDLLEEFTYFLPSDSDQHCNSTIDPNKNEHKYAVDVSNAENKKLNVESDHGAENCSSCGLLGSSDGDKCSMPDIERSDPASFLLDTSDQHSNSVTGANKNEHKYTADVSDADNKLNVESDHDVSDSSEDEIGLKSVCSQDCEKVNQRDPD